MEKIIHFIKYNNAFAFIVAILFVATASVFASSPELRQDAVSAIYSHEEKVLSVDNAQLLSANLEAFNPSLQIKDIKEDSDNYYVRYAYKTLAIKDYIWQESNEEKILTVSKVFLANKDLGLYVAKELGEVIDYNLSYLKEAQVIEKKNGESNKVIAVAYGGLVGKFLDPKQKEFPQYVPVVEEKKKEELVQSNGPNQPILPLKNGEQAAGQATAEVVPNREVIRQMVQEAMREILASSSSSQVEISSSSSSESNASSNSSSFASSSSELSSSSASLIYATTTESSASSSEASSESATSSSSASLIYATTTESVAISSEASSDSATSFEANLSSASSGDSVAASSSSEAASASSAESSSVSNSSVTIVQETATSSSVSSAPQEETVNATSSSASAQ